MMGTLSEFLKKKTTTAGAAGYYYISVKKEDILRFPLFTVLWRKKNFITLAQRQTKDDGTRLI